MADFRLQINLDNAAFRSEHVDPELIEYPEVAAVIHRIADRIAAGEAEGDVIEVNGNKVGTFEIYGD